MCTCHPRRGDRAGAVSWAEKKVFSADSLVWAPSLLSASAHACPEGRKNKIRK